jgi:CheY-like chemotaxis protein
MKKRVLLVEDEQQLNDLYKQLLEGDGYDVQSSLNGKDAFELIEGGGFDLILLDIMLPGMDGLEILEALGKKPPKNPNKSIVLLTNLAENETIARALKNGVNGYIIKSRFSPEEFLEEVKKHFV